MSLTKIKLTEADRIFILDGGEDIGCGNINDDGHLYFINKTEMEAAELPDKYQNTPIILYHPCGGYQDGLIMVSLMGSVDLQYHHTFYDTAGMWGWIDLDGNEVIAPQFVFAMSFFEGKAIVCKGSWSTDEDGRYWCENEQWGIIDRAGKEIVPFQYDEIYFVDGSDRLILCHKGGWETGHNCVFDIQRGEEILDLDFDFDNGYMFNSVWVLDDLLFFDNHDAFESVDYIYVYSLTEQKWLAYREVYQERTLNGQKKVIVKMKDGQEIHVF